MKRTAMAAACAFALAGAAFAQDQEYSAYYTGGSAPTIDANLNDWSGVPEGVALTEFREHGGGKWNGEDDASGTFWLLWDENGLYFAADITDDSHLNTGVGGGIWNGDGAQVAIDPTAERGGGGNMYEFNFGLGGTQLRQPAIQSPRSNLRQDLRRWALRRTITPLRASKPKNGPSMKCSSRRLRFRLRLSKRAAPSASE